MAGNHISGIKTRDKLKAEDPDYYRNLGKLGGATTGVKKGFASMTPEKRSAAGRKGGLKSRKGRR